jgi:Protein of unknown function (DUF2934)
MQGTEIDRDEEIRQLAYRLWQESGCPTGSDLQHWLKAQEMWQEKHRPKNRTKPAKAKKPRQARTLKRDL